MSNIATHKSNGLIKRHSRREALCTNLAARGAAGLRAIDIVTLDAFRQAQADEIRTQINQCIDLSLVDASNELGTLLHRIRESDNASRITLRITEAGRRALLQISAPRATSAGMKLIASPARQRIDGIQNPLARPPLTRPGADDHRQHPSRAGASLATYTPHP